MVHVLTISHDRDQDIMLKSEFQVKQEAKNFSEKQKGFRDGLSYSTPQKSKETSGNVITQPRNHPIK